MKMQKILLLLVPIIWVLSSCGPSSIPAANMTEKGDQVMTFTLTSAAFEPEAEIPAQYTCDGQDISPPLSWSDPPEGTQSFALIMDDPDAPVGTWDHWLLFNLPGDMQELPEQVGTPAGSVDGKNSWGRTGYGGPCPPGGTHRYFFKLYALDTHLDLAAGADKDQLLEAMDGHILGQAELMGTYTRQS